MRILAALCALVVLSACAMAPDHEPAVAALCAEPREDFSLPLASDIPSDSAVRQRFGGACDQLGGIEGLDFGANRSAYRCRYFVPRRDDARAVAARAVLDAVFGRRVGAAAGDMAMEPDDVRARILAHRAGSGRSAAELDLPLDVSSGIMGYAATAVILMGDRDGRPTVLLTRGELDGALVSVRDWQGAMTLMELSSVLGQTGIAAFLARERGEEVRPVQCTARVARSDAGGWHLDRMTIKRNCNEPLERSVSVGPRGTVVVTASRQIAGAQFSCFD